MVPVLWFYNVVRGSLGDSEVGMPTVGSLPGGGRRFKVACDVAFLLCNTVCVARPHFRPGGAAFKANGLSWAGF